MGMKILKIKYHLVAIFRIFFYKILFGKRFMCGKGTSFRRFFNIYLDKKATIKIGRNCFFNHCCSINSLEKIEIGGGCIFGENVKIYDHNHRFAELDKSIKDQGYSTSVIVIGDNCWFGSNVTVLKGAKIGNNCVIGAGSIISTVIPDNSIVTVGRELNIKNIKKE